MADAPTAEARNARPHLVLTGPMSAGKSTVGRACALRLGAAFVDLDDAIEQATGRSVAAIFAEDGESGFRQVEETVAIESLRASHPMVLALGGGAILSAALRRELARRGDVLVALRASPATAARRALHDRERVRPLLAVADPVGTLAELARTRARYYDAVSIQVVTDDRAIDAIVDEVVDAYERSRR